MGMNMNLTGNRMSALAGFAFVVLTLVANFMAGSQPQSKDSAQKIAHFFTHHHKALLAAAVLTGLAAPMFVWVFASLARAMRRAGESALAVVAFGIVVVGAGLATASDAVFASLVHAATQGDKQFTKSGFDLSAFLVQKAFWFAAFLALAVWLGSKSMPSSYRWLTLVAGVLFVIAGLGVRQHGFFATFGPATFIGFIALLVWVLGTSAVLWRMPEAEEAPAAAAMTA